MKTLPVEGFKKGVHSFILKIMFYPNIAAATAEITAIITKVERSPPLPAMLSGDGKRTASFASPVATAASLGGSVIIGAGVGASVAGDGGRASSRKVRNTAGGE